MLLVRALEIVERSVFIAERRVFASDARCRGLTGGLQLGAINPEYRPQEYVRTVRTV
jgi:hypothetical protein